MEKEYMDTLAKKEKSVTKNPKKGKSNKGNSNYLPCVSSLKRKASDLQSDRSNKHTRKELRTNLNKGFIAADYAFKRKSQRKFKLQEIRATVNSLENPEKLDLVAEVSNPTLNTIEKVITEAEKEIKIQEATATLEKEKLQFSTKEKLQLSNPFEEVIASIDNSEKWTAAFTVTLIHNKPTRTLADTGASHSVISQNWLRYLKLERFIHHEEMTMVSAQKQSITVMGTIAITVMFGGKEFEWVVRVAPELICPFIMGMDILNQGCINCKERYVEISET